MVFHGGNHSRDRRGWTSRPGWGRDWRGGGSAAFPMRGSQGGWGPVHHQRDDQTVQEKEYFGLFGSRQEKADVAPIHEAPFLPNFSHPPPTIPSEGLLQMTPVPTTSEIGPPFPDFSRPPPVTELYEAKEEGASTSTGSHTKRIRTPDVEDEQEEPTKAKKPKLPTSKYLLSFKSFLETQDDHITEEESLSLYREYKAEHKRQQNLQFFEDHKEEEWLMELYHPVCKERRKLEEQARVARRSDVFWSIFEDGMNGLKMEVGQEEMLIKAMDGFVLGLGKLERKEGACLTVKSEPMPTLEEGASPSEDNVDEEEPSPLGVSLFLRHVPLSVPASMVEELGRRCEGFQRVALGQVTFKGDGQPMRKAWITYDPTTDIKQVCVSLSGSKLGGVEVLPMVNKKLSSRIREGPKLSGNQHVMKRDLKLSSCFLRKLEAKLETPSKGGINQLLEKAEGMLNNDEDGKLTEESTEERQEFADCLDSILVYLRMVHSVDWYTCTVYKEDKMPNRLGILHVRPKRPSPDYVEGELKEYLDRTQKRIDLMTQEKPLLSEKEVMSLGGKIEEEELEKFFRASVEELTKDKWQCKLSQKKFRSYEFVKKHILNKFPVEVKQVKMEVEYLKNFLADPERPSLPELLMPVPTKQPLSKTPGPKNCREKKVIQELEEEFMESSSQSSTAGRRDDLSRGFHARGFYLKPQPLPADVNEMKDPRETIDYSDIDTLLELPHIKRACPW